MENPTLFTNLLVSSTQTTHQLDVWVEWRRILDFIFGNASFSLRSVPIYVVNVEMYQMCNKLWCIKKVLHRSFSLKKIGRMALTRLPLLTSSFIHCRIQSITEHVVKYDAFIALTYSYAIICYVEFAVSPL